MKKYSINIISTNPWKIKLTKDYKKQVKIIKNEIGLKYQDLMKNEINILKKIILWINKIIEIRRAINKLTSLDKLYLK